METSDKTESTEESDTRKQPHICFSMCAHNYNEHFSADNDIFNSIQSLDVVRMYYLYMILGMKTFLRFFCKFSESENEWKIERNREGEWEWEGEWEEEWEKCIFSADKEEPVLSEILFTFFMN